MDHGQQRLDKGDYVPPTARTELGGPSIDFAKLQHDKMTLVSHQILNSATFMELGKFNPFDLLTDDGSLQFDDASFNGLLSDLLECLTIAPTITFLRGLSWAAQTS